MCHLSFRIPPAPSKMNLADSSLLMGSCFSDNIGKKMLDCKFDVASNPMGTIYNPISCFRILQNTLQKHHYSDPIENQGVFYDWNTHSELSALDPKELDQRVHDAYSQLAITLQQVDTIIITPGTAWVYELKTTGQIVANCHKVPQSNFRKRLLEVSEILESYEQLRKLMKERKLAPKWIFTVSPVRHIRDGLIENNRSKAILHLAIRRITESYSDCSYFPGYEIQIDQLRDYRYYKRDLIHPSDEAIDFIWDRFVETHFDQDTIDFVQKWSKILRALDHRPNHPESEAHQKFIRETISKLEKLAKVVDTSVEIAQLKEQIVK